MIYDSTNEMISRIQCAINEINNAKDDLQKLCDKEKLDTYYTFTIDERLNEAKIQSDMSLTRIEESRKETDNLNLSMSGFY